MYCCWSSAVVFAILAVQVSSSILVSSVVPQIQVLPSLGSGLAEVQPGFPYLISSASLGAIFCYFLDDRIHHSSSSIVMMNASG